MTAEENRRNSSFTESQTTDTDNNESGESKKKLPQSTSKSHHRSERFYAMTEYEPVEYPCHGFKVNLCAPPVHDQDPLSNKTRDEKSRKIPGKSQASKDSIFSKKEKILGMPRKSEIFTASKNYDFDDVSDQNLMRDIEKITQRIDIYYFDHGNSAYYKTTDAPPMLTTEKCAEKTDQAATRFWAEIFGTIHIGITFITAFILQLLRFFLYSLVRPLTVGVIQMFADYLIKPLLTIIFNGIIQPILILLYNIATSFRDLCEPIAQSIGFFIREFAILFRAIRLVEANHYATLPT